MTTSAESLEFMQRRVDDLERVCANLNARLAALDPASGPLQATRRKLLEVEMRVAKIERGPLISAGQPYSD